MGSIQIAPYHPLEQQPGPLQQMAQVLGVQNQQQQIQAGAQENQMRAQQINDQKAMTAAMHEWDGKDFDTLVPLASKNGASAQAVMGLKAKQLEIKDKYSQIAKNDSETGAKNLESMKQKNDMVLGGINGLSDVGDDQIGQKTAATAQNLIQQGLIDPQHGQALLQIAQQDPKSIRAALPMFSKDYMSQSAQMTKAKDDADLAAKKAQLPGQVAESDMKQSEAAAMKQYGGLTGPAADAKYRFIVQKQKLGNPLNPEEQAYVGAYAQQKTLNTTTKIQMGGNDRNAARSDKSYQFSSGQLEKVAAPVDQAVARISRLNDSLAQNSPQADALVAPELLSVMAGGSGSGLRMNEAEIARVIGGRSKWESLKASINQWSLDPSKANSITPDQRNQIHALMTEVNNKLTAKQSALDDARQGLINTDDVNEHRKIVANARSKMTAIDGGQQQAGGTITVTDPNGGVHTFKSQGEADNFKKLAKLP